MRWVQTDAIWNSATAPWPLFRHDVRRTGHQPIRRLFVRGDADGNGQVDMGDYFAIRHYLGGQGPVPGCMDAGDANDDGSVTSADATYILGFLYSGGPPPPPPFTSCGLDTTEDAVTCYDYPLCP